VVDVRLNANPVLSAAYSLENVPFLYLGISCAIVTAMVKAKLFYDAQQTINNATCISTEQKDMWKFCSVKNVETYFAKRNILLQRRFESMGCQMLCAQWNEPAIEPALSCVVVMTVDTTNSVIKVFKFLSEFFKK
jgi:hypothetical protein